MNEEAYNLDSLRNQDQAEARTYGYSSKNRYRHLLQEILAFYCWIKVPLRLI